MSGVEGFGEIGAGLAWGAGVFCMVRYGVAECARSGVEDIG